METKLRALLDNPEEMRAAGERARRVINARFSPAVLGPKYASFFESLA
jgi:glycosyltransferase involved in cell wall biosynthesis